MRKTLLSVLGLLCFMIMQAQVAKTVNMTQAGTLDGLLTANEKNTITDLILTGPIDARDFKTMREQIYRLAVLDMEGAKTVSCMCRKEVQRNIKVLRNGIYLGISLKWIILRE